MAEKPFPAYEGDEPYFFVSYSHEEADLVYPEMVWIRETGFKLWYDDGIHVGAVWRQSLADALTGSSALIFFATANSTLSSNCLKELNFILDEDKPVFVVQLDDTPLPSLLRLSLSDRQALVRSEYDEGAYRSRLVSALSTIVAPNIPTTSTDEPGTVSDGVKTDPPSMVVLLPTYLGTDQEMMSLRDGLTGGLVARLADQGWHIVAGQADDANQEPQQIGARRGVRYLLGGTLQGGEARIRLTIHLTDASTGQELWVQRYDRETGDLFQLQDQLVNSIGHDLFDAVLRVEYRRLREVPDDELDAWGLCARAQRPVIDKASRERVLELLERAVNLDPRFAMAHSVYGAVVAQIIFNQFTHNIEKYSKLALEHTDRALALAPNNVVVLSQAALVQRIVGDPDDALRLAQRESQITGQPSASLLAALMVSGRFDEALEIGNAQPELVVSSELVAANMVMKRFDQAYEWARRATALEPDAFLNWLHLAAVQAQLGQAETAQASLDRARTIVPTISLDLFENGLRVAWRRDDIVDAIMGGFRKLGVQ